MGGASMMGGARIARSVGGMGGMRDMPVAPVMAGLRLGARKAKG